MLEKTDIYRQFLKELSGVKLLRPVNLAVIQPSFLPWRGYFQIIAASDKFVLYDDVQYDKHGWRNRNQIKVGQAVQWITVPVKTKGRFGQLIRDVEIDNDLPWKRKILGAVKSAYLRAPFFGKFYPWLEQSLGGKFLIDLDEKLTVDVCGFLKIGTPIIRSSALQLTGSDPVDRLLQICEKTEATRYISGPSAKAYLKPEAFVAKKIELHYQDYSTLKPYRQLSEPFLSNVSVLDALMCLDSNLDLGQNSNVGNRETSIQIGG